MGEHKETAMPRKKRQPKPIYLDVCAVNRRYDDMSNMRILIEAAEVQLIIGNVINGTYKLYYSPMHEVEIRGNPSEINREELLSLIHTLGADMSLLMEKEVVIDRARDLNSGGIKAADAVHVAYAEAAGADFVTCDDALIKKCKRHGIKAWFGLPSDFVAKERIA